MPLLKLETTVELSETQRNVLLGSLSRTVAQILAKPEQYVMVILSPTACLMSGQTGPAAFVDVRSIGGLSASVNRQLAAGISQVLREALGIPADRVYLNFTDIDARNWGWNGATFE